MRAGAKSRASAEAARMRAALEPPRTLAPAPSLPLSFHLEQQDDRLTHAGFHPLSPWWRRTIGGFLASGRRRFVGRVGRRGGKGVTMARVACLLALHGEYRIPPGEVGMFAFVSVKREEAYERVRNIAAVLDALGEPYHAAGGDILLERRPILFRVLTASIAGVSGPTCIGAVCDELSKWKDAKTGVNPASEVLASLRPTMATQPNARLFMVSSPMGELDAHAAAYAEGDTAVQMVAAAPSWEANPTLTEQGTRDDEPNESVWLREYAAVPMQGTEESIFHASLLDRATRPARTGAPWCPDADVQDLPREDGVEYVAAMDPALVRNAWTFCIAALRTIGGRLCRSIVAVREWRGSPRKPLRPDVVLADIARVCRRYHIDTVHTDEFHGQSLQVIAERDDINLSVVVWPTSAPQKIERYEAMLTQLSDNTVDLPPSRMMRADLLAVRRVLTPNGFVIRLPETPDGRHCDHASSVTLALSKCTIEPTTLVPAARFGEPGYYAAEQERIVRHMEEQWARRKAS